MAMRKSPLTFTDLVKEAERFQLARQAEIQSSTEATEAVKALKECVEHYISDRHLCVLGRRFEYNIESRRAQWIIEVGNRIVHVQIDIMPHIDFWYAPTGFGNLFAFSSDPLARLTNEIVHRPVWEHLVTVLQEVAL
jgi:hypothetical protein